MKLLRDAKPLPADCLGDDTCNDIFITHDNPVPRISMTPEADKTLRLRNRRLGFNLTRYSEILETHDAGLASPEDFEHHHIRVDRRLISGGSYIPRNIDRIEIGLTDVTSMGKFFLHEAGHRVDYSNADGLRRRQSDNRKKLACIAIEEAVVATPLTLAICSAEVPTPLKISAAMAVDTILLAGVAIRRTLLGTKRSEKFAEQFSDEHWQSHDDMFQIVRAEQAPLNEHFVY